MFQLTPRRNFGLPADGTDLHLVFVLNFDRTVTFVDWGRTLRDYRARSGTNQQSLASQLGISQPQVSRIEAGTACPRDDVISAIRNLIARPDNRSPFDGLITAIRFSPHVICLLQPAGDNVRYVALSRGFREHPQFRTVEIGQTVRKQASRNGAALLMKTIDSGVFDGEITAIDAIWEAERDGCTNYWHGITTPIRSSNGGWYLHCAMEQLDASRFEELAASRDEALILHTMH